MRTSSGSSRPIGLRIEGRSTKEFESGRTGGEFGSPALWLPGSFQSVIFLCHARGRLVRLGIPVAPNI